MTKIEIAAFYKFARLPQFEALRGPIQRLCAEHDVHGTILLAGEGINGTVAATPAGMAAFLAKLKALTGFADLEHKASFAQAMPFLRMKVRLKAEIVTMGEAVDPLHAVGTYVEPKDWNALISDPEVLVIDTRNDFEVRIGSFKGAVDPRTKSFGEFPGYVRAHLDPARHKKVAMFCTGGIRCEKATSLLKQEGFGEVYHLKGGILKYLEEVPADDSLWDGACFVFDERVAVGHGLQVEDYSLCHGCLTPLSPQDRAHAAYEEGVACFYCAANLSEAQKASNRERHRQVKLAAGRGDRHLGPKERDEPASLRPLPTRTGPGGH